MGKNERGQHPRNIVLEGLLARARWTPENLGDHLNQLAAAQKLGLYVNRRYVRRWVYAEKGRPAPRVPRDPWPSLVCLVLHQRLGEPVTLSMLGWPEPYGLMYVPADHGLDQDWDPPGVLAALGEVMDVTA